MGTLAIVAICAGHVAAQDMPRRTTSRFSTPLGKAGDFKDNVLKVNIPRSDLKVRSTGRDADAVRLRRLGRPDEGRPAGWTS